MNRTTYENLTLDEERALYNVQDATITRCAFQGPADGESALKESGNLLIDHCDFQLRYPLWHVKKAEIRHSAMSETCRAALWYDRDISLRHCTLNGIKALRECDNSAVADCKITSPEFGWLCRGVRIQNTELTSEYPFLHSRDMEIEGLVLKGKYSFQYVENVTVRHSVLDTKDAFWHSKNVTVMDSVIKGEYLAWYCENLTLVRCKIIGTQPLCYARGLVLEDCEMTGTDLSFEYSDVKATVRGKIDSVKNPVSGKIEADEIGEIILDEHRSPNAACEIIANKKSGQTENALSAVLSAQKFAG